MYYPADYQKINSYNSQLKPSTVHVTDTGLNNYFRRYLLQKALSVFKFDGIPEHWSLNYFLYTLFINGFVAIVRTDKFGVIPQHCSLYGYDVFYQPTNVTIANPLLRGILQPRIGTQCALIRLQPDYGSAWDIITYYADLLTLASEALGVNLVNSKLAFVFGADSKQAAESYKKMFDKIASGEPAAFVDKNLFDEDGKPRWFSFNQNLEQNYIADDILQDISKIEARFDTEIGIPNINIAKESGVSNAEIMSNNIDTKSKAELWLDCLQDGIKQTNDLFGLDLSVKLRFEGDFSNAGINNDTIQLR